MKLTDEDKAKQIEEIAALRDEIESLTRRIGYIDRDLFPIRERREELKAQIRRTHGTTAKGVLSFNRDTAVDRKPLFEGLLQISAAYGKAFNERAELKTRSRSYERQADRLQRELDRKAKQEKRK